MKKNLKIILISVSLAACIGFLLLKKTSEPAGALQPTLPLICLSQIIEHPALDEERRGIIDALKSAGYIDGQTIKITYQNAQGNLATAAQIAKMQAGQNPAVMVGISTPSAQALLSVATSHAIPLVFTAVTNPVDAKLVKDNVFGVSDALPLDSQIALMREFLPNLKTIGVIYNAGEVNSTHVVRELKALCEKENIVLIPAIAAKTSDVAGAAQSLAGRVDAIYVPNDNTAVSAMASIVQVASIAKLAVFAGDTGSVHNGALATRGYDRFQLGQKTGALIVRILKHEKMEKNIDNTHDLHVYVNEKTLKMLGISVPQSLNKDVILIGTKK
ncbi:MAG: ABC transporter substrate-binding protein [Pseudomonadota bacterium]